MGCLLDLRMLVRCRTFEIFLEPDPGVWDAENKGLNVNSTKYQESRSLLRTRNHLGHAALRNRRFNPETPNPDPKPYPKPNPKLFVQKSKNQSRDAAPCQGSFVNEDQLIGAGDGFRQFPVSDGFHGFLGFRA